MTATKNIFDNGRANVCRTEGVVNHRIKITSPPRGSIHSECPWRVLHPDLTVAAEGVADTFPEAVEAVLAKWEELGFTL